MNLRLSALLMTASLAACGGGGSSGGSEPDPKEQVNRAPTINAAISAETTDGAAVELDLAQFASDPDGDALSIKDLGMVQHGSISSSGLVMTYDPDDGYAGSDSFSVTITDGEFDATATVSITAYQGMKVSGKVVDEPVPGASVTVTVDGEEFTVVADDEGDYVLEFKTTNLSAYIKLEATGSDENGTGDVKLVSLLGEVETLLGEAGEDRELGGSESTAANITNVTTARYVLAVEANGGEEITSDEAMATAEKSIDADKLLEIAAVIKVVLDNPDYDLPEGAGSVLDLVTDTEAYNVFVAEVTSANSEDNALTQAMDQIVKDPALVQGFTEDNIANIYYSTLPAAPGFLSRGGDRYEFRDDGTGIVANEVGHTSFTWSVENGQIAITYDQPLEYYGWYAAADVLEPADADQWLQETGSAQIGATTTEKSVTFTRLVDGDIIDTTSYEMTYDRVFDTGDTGISAPNKTDALGDGRLLLRDADASVPLPIVAADLEDTWAVDSYYEHVVGTYEGPQNVSGYAGDLLQFVEGGTGSALLSGRSFTWSLQDNTVRLDFDDETSLLVQKIDEAGDLSAFALRTLDSEGDLLAFSYNFGTWQDPSAALTAERIVTEPGRHWATFVNGWFVDFWDGGVFDYIGGSGFGWEFNQDGTSSGVQFTYDGLDEDGDGNTEEVVDYRMPGSWSIGADGILRFTRFCPDNCRRREWLGLQASDGELIVMEREFFTGEEIEPLVFQPRLNIYRDWENPEVNRAPQPVSVRAVAYPTLKGPGGG